MNSQRFVTSLSVAAFCLTGSALAQNDECTGAIAITGGSTPFSTIGATTSAPAWPCALGGSDIWYSYTVPASGVSGVTFDTCGSSYDTALEVFTGTCASLIPVNCNDDSACGLQSEINVPTVTPGEQLFVRVGGFNSNTGPGVLNVTELGPPVQGCVLNPGFESGTLAGWNIVDNTAPFSPMAVVPLGADIGFGFFTAEPTEGDFAFRTGFDGNGPETMSISQDVMVSPGLTPLTFDYRAAWDMQTFGGSTQDRTFSVVIRDSSGTPLQTTLILTAAAGSQNFDTGPMSAAIDLSAFLGQTVTVSLEWFVPETFTGPAQFQIDNISCPSAPGVMLGTNYCTAAANSSGAPGTISATGSGVAAANNFTLTASSLPANQFGLFVVSATQGFVPGAGGTSNGNLCLGGQIGRINIVQNSGATGEFSLMVDLAAIPQGGGTVSVGAGDTWNFQAWFRDGVGLGSNFTDGLSVLFQ